MTVKPTLAVVGATGAVGTVMLDLLTTREDVWGEIKLVASPRSAGRVLSVRGRDTEVAALAPEVFDGVDVAMFDVPDEVSAHWAPIAAARGAIVVDNSGAFRMDPDVPLVVPEVNAADTQRRPKGIIANPNCTTLSLIVAIGALHRAFRLRSMVVASYQAASGAGQSGIDTLYGQLEKVAGTRTLGQRAGDLRPVVGDLGPFPAPLAMNVVPWAGSLKDEGWSSEELKIRNESRKILGVPDLKVSATCVRVPVVTTHSVAVHAEFASPVTREAAWEALRAAPGVVVSDSPESGEFPTPADVVGTDPTWVGRVRQSLDEPNVIEFFVCGDNLRKGAALNTAQIAEVVAAELAMLRAAPGTVRFGTYNAFNLSASDWAHYQQVVAVISELNPDVLAVQEVLGRPEEAVALLRKLASDTGLRCAVDGDTALAYGGHGCHAGLLWRQGIDAVPGSLRRWGGPDFWHGLVLLTLDVGGTLVRHGAFHATPFGRALRADQNERLCGLVRTSGAEPALVGADWNTVCADRDAAGTLYEPDDPYAASEWFEDLVHQCVWSYDGPDGRVHAADRVPGDVLWSGGLLDAAAQLDASWQPTTGHHPDDVFARHGISRRIDAIRVTDGVVGALRTHHTLDTPAARAASDHLPAAVDYAPADISLT
jgi:aspartate-semialdehyde dehydrogenase